MRRTLQATALLALLILGNKAFWWLSLKAIPLPTALLEQDYSTLSLAPDGRLLRIALSPSDKYRIRLPLSQIDENLKKGVLLYEDRYFYVHPGINPAAVLRSAAANMRHRRVLMGGSTLTLQIAKMMEPKRRTWRAKAIELFRALQLEAAYSKTELFELYLNMVPMGGNIEGVGAASYLYFGKPAQHLSFGEIALLIGLPRSPNSYRPDLRPQAAQRQKVKIMNRIGPRLGMSQDVIAANAAAPLPHTRFPNPFLCPHLVVRTRTLTTETTQRYSIIPSLQMHCEALLRKAVESLRRERSYNGAVIVIDNKTMKVLAYVGSPDFNDAEHGGQVNGAAIWRSPGSLLKPFLYAAAIDQGVLTPRKVLFDIERNYDGYIPANFDKRFMGPVPAEEALARSLNVPAINLEYELGQNGLAALVRRSRLGDPRRLPTTAGLSLVLGAYPFTLEELVRLYSVFANKGMLRDLVFFEEDAARPNQGFRLLSPESCFIMAEVLAKLERPDLPQVWEFTANRGKIAFKTGTSFGLRDAWTIGFNPDYTVGVWLGNVDSKGSSALVGIKAAAPVVVSIFNDLTRYDDHWFKKPERVKAREVCSVSGLPLGPFCQAKTQDVSIPGVTQNNVCTVHRRIWVQKKDGLEVCSACMTGPRAAYAEKIVQVWMPDVASFLRQKGFSTVLLPRHNPACKSPRNEQGLKIRSPMAGGYYAVTDVMAGAAQKIPLMLQSQSGTDRVYWFVDDVFLGQGSPDQTHYLKPIPGRHRLSVVDGRGQFDSVEFFRPAQMVKRAALILVLWALPASAADVRVGLFQKELPQTFSVTSPSGLSIEDKASGRPLGDVGPSEIVVLEKSANQVRVLLGSKSTSYSGALCLRPQKGGSVLKLSTPRIPERLLQGVVDVEARDRELLAVNSVPDETYLSAVISGELPRAWPLEALKAQAVVARTFILKNKFRHRSDGYDFCDLAHCQVYKGTGAPNPAVAQAVQQTHKEVLLYEGALIEAFFHSACGGHTASVEEVWNASKRPYLKGQSDQDAQSVHAFCRSSPDYRWRLDVESKELGTVLAYGREEGPRLGTLLQFDILETAPSGWVQKIRARFAGQSLDLSGYAFYLLWGRMNRWHELKSGFFTVSKQGDTYHFEGRGLGHGIGLCQWGAYGRARSGADYRTILTHYFPHTQLQRKEW